MRGGWLISCVYIEYYGEEMAPMAPWRTPARIEVKFEISEPTLVAKNLFSRYDLKNK